MARITDLDPIENEQVNNTIDLLHLVDVSSETSVDKKITVAKFHKTAPAASATEKGDVTTGEQSFAGDKTFKDDVNIEGDLVVTGDIKQLGNPFANGQLFSWDAIAQKAVGKSVDTEVTAGSSNPVSSSGVKIYVDTSISSVVGAGFSHNIPRITPKDITVYYQNGTLWQRLNGTDGFTLFEDIYVGDYFQMSRPITTPNQDPQYAATGTDWVTIAGINTLAGNGDNIDMWFNHLVMIPGKGDLPGVNYFGRNRMNPTDTTAGGYYNSELHQSILGPVVSAGSTAAGATVNQQLYAEFGAHLKTTRELLTDNIGPTLNNRFGNAGGASSSWAWYSCQSCLMSEVEVFGATIWSSSGFDTGNAKTRLPLFNFSTKALNNRWSWYWLKDIASAALFCYVNGNGDSSYRGASDAGAFVRPRFVLGA